MEVFWEMLARRGLGRHEMRLEICTARVVRVAPSGKERFSRSLQRAKNRCFTVSVLRRTAVMALLQRDRSSSIQTGISMASLLEVERTDMAWCTKSRRREWRPSSGGELGPQGWVLPLWRTRRGKFFGGPRGGGGGPIWRRA